MRVFTQVASSFGKAAYTVMSLEDTLENLDGTLRTQNEINQQLIEVISANTYQSASTNAEIIHNLERFRSASEASARMNSEIGNLVSGLQRITAVTSEQSSQALAQLTNQAGQIQSSTEAFAEAASETTRSVIEFGKLVELMSESLKLQRDAIQTQIKLANESSRSSWIQSGLFFLLGVLIPVLVQLAFRFLH